MFPAYAAHDFAAHHEDYWAWVWALRRGERPHPFVAIWPRGGAKSTSAELAVVALGALARRRYVLYVSGTQDQADDHVQNVADMLESSPFDDSYPDLADRDISKYGQSRGWRRNRLRTRAGYTVDAVGLDKQSRGRKLDEDRPDLIVFDDLDDEADSPATTDKKIRAITKKLIPAGAPDLAVLAVQNLVHENSIFSQLADGRAKFLADRFVSGPIPAVRNLEYREADNRVEITAGEASWEGQDLDRCEEMVNDMGLEAFASECQQEVSAPLGTLVYRLFASALERGLSVAPNREAEQFLAIDPGYSKRAAMLAIQERGDKAEMWREWSFHRCEDDHIAKTAAEHCFAWGVKTVYFDSESPELGAAIRKHLRLRYKDVGLKPPRVDSVPFNKYKRLAIKATRWLMQMGAVAWGAETTEYHEPKGDDYAVSEIPGAFRAEVRRYQLVPGKEDEAVKENDHGPDAWHAYAARWVPLYLKNLKERERANGAA